MKAIIHCGGKGTRLPEVSKIMPKPMVIVDGKPLLYWHIKNLKAAGILEICITLHYLPKVIMNYFGDGKKFGVNIIYSYERQLLGTGGGLQLIKDFINEDILILYGDVISDVNYKKMFLFHKKRGGLVTAAVHSSSHPEDSDLVIFDKKFRLLRILKKPHGIIPDNPHNLAALYIVSPKIVGFLGIPKPFDIAQDLLPYLLERGRKIFCYNTSEFMMDIGTPERLRKAHELLKK